MAYDVPPALAKMAPRHELWVERVLQKVADDLVDDLPLRAQYIEVLELLAGPATWAELRAERVMAYRMSDTPGGHAKR